MFIEKDKNMFKKKGFTLFEMLIVISLFAILLPTIFAILSTILRQQLRLYRIVEAKRQGDAAMSFMKNQILRQGVAIEDEMGQAQCNDALDEYSPPFGDNFRIIIDKSNGNNEFYYFIQSGQMIGYVRGMPIISTSLTTNIVTVINFHISCFRRSLNSPPIIEISYTVQSTDGINTIILPYRTKVRLISAP
ncbi:hypothetical protein A3A93_04080 [Candidatus Roizmanbacteria bacterium RIFCSPLOWO2_01_FULL_38_12]|uniref:Prepilin-type N-terminal cleavage/methylation domain-containing protein n=1 Tax=Candidatus Roizmanbacteria bacterium RIFCSPLOWO2_01_FULL_38_12 TaxID=1802061 RepID=A0A1F7IV02_9BACT|nr:MAG: hypothetical protein A2861_00545 [Candidatus Roizmanbacteria bacterium RIFCSPHIGHO2_01_FULL_38_15]OGK35030.1 MAG: hypothetical protein A3F59_00255 [Candidatus Roizmanbacteria bacterium RIFCSPHIGHO2_12_FULL_38_13]OGK47185.1 MAG: hypothetical protein A3A93_04080 [Candidatus Roizmanbacteria bacterium RIFCSPLOWO2_01_FULL_38_12]